MTIFFVLAGSVCGAFIVSHMRMSRSNRCKDNTTNRTTPHFCANQAKHRAWMQLRGHSCNHAAITECKPNPNDKTCLLSNCRHLFKCSQRNCAFIGASHSNYASHVITLMKYGCGQQVANGGIADLSRRAPVVEQNPQQHK